MAGVRANYKIEDIQRCIKGLIAKLVAGTAPWTSWQVVFGWPETDINNKLVKPTIYVLEPILIDQLFQQGGQTGLGLYEMIMGAWDDRYIGGTEEINIIGSRILNLFNDANTVHTTQFDVTLDSAYTNTTLITQGIRIVGIGGPRVIDTEDRKEFRREFDLRLKA